MGHVGGTGGTGGDAFRAFDPGADLELLDDAVAQWLDWEEQANLIGFRASTVPVEVEFSSIPRDELEIHVLPDAPPSLVAQFLRGDRVLCGRHPLNRDPTVAWTRTPVTERWSARFTSSRTLAMYGAESGARLFSLKLATDHPHPDFLQPEKTRLREEAQDAVRWGVQLRRIDALLEPMIGVRLVPDVVVVLARGGETGFMVRDLRAFQDGDYTLPALSLPFVGRQIARRHGEPFESFWARQYAAPVGRAKARILSRYGMWFETPNPQNLLLRLDRSLRPRPEVVIRDVGDGECATDAFDSTDQPWSRLTNDLRPETENSFWAFGEAGPNSVDHRTLQAWHRAHDDAYFAELASAFPAIAPPESLPADARLDHWNRTLRTPLGEKSVRQLFARIAVRSDPDREDHEDRDRVRSSGGAIDSDQA